MKFNAINFIVIIIFLRTGRHTCSSILLELFSLKYTGVTHCCLWLFYFQIVDIAVDHPSCSKQHAVLQYRLVDYTKTDGTASKKVKYVVHFCISP